MHITDDPEVLPRSRPGLFIPLAHAVAGQAQIIRHPGRKVADVLARYTVPDMDKERLGQLEAQ